MSKNLLPRMHSKFYSRSRCFQQLSKISFFFFNRRYTKSDMQSHPWAARQCQNLSEASFVFPLYFLSDLGSFCWPGFRWLICYYFMFIIVCLHSCMYIVSVCRVPRGQKRVLNSLEFETVVGLHVGAGNPTWVHRKNSRCSRLLGHFSSSLPLFM